jgi:hypothetical protein
VAQEVCSWHALAFRIPQWQHCALVLIQIVCNKNDNVVWAFQAPYSCPKPSGFLSLNRRLTSSSSPSPTAKCFTVRRWVAVGSQLAVARGTVFSVATCCQHKCDQRGTFIYSALGLRRKRVSATFLLFSFNCNCCLQSALNHRCLKQIRSNYILH